MALPKGTAHSHAEDYDAALHNVAKVVHPTTGEKYAFTYPKAAGRRVRYELPDGTLGEIENPDAPAEADPAEGDVIYDPRTGEWVPRLTAAEAGHGADSSRQG